MVIGIRIVSEDHYAKQVSYLKTIDDVVLIEHWKNEVIDHQHRANHAEHRQRVNGAVHINFPGNRYY